MRIFNFHMVKLMCRSLMFLALFVLFLMDPGAVRGDIYAGFSHGFTLPNIFWLILVVEALLRFFPSTVESRGCQKQFKSFYLPGDTALTDELLKGFDRERVAMDRSAALVAVSWIALNAVVAGFYFTHMIDEAALLLISAFYTVCDMICILFYCPFQAWIMKNRCCVTCRIYNWDFIMICTPLFFLQSFISWSLCLIAIFLLAQWEYTYHRYPERFYQRTNASLKCSNCKDKMCRYKPKKTY